MGPTFVMRTMLLPLILPLFTTVCGATNFRHEHFHKAHHLVARQGLNVPQAPLANWTYTGCYTDQVTGRALTGATTASGTTMTNEFCVDYCATRGFAFAGTEYSAECFCGNSIVGSNGPATDPANCNMPCSGDATEACGGPNRLTLFSGPTPVGPFVNPGVNGFRSLGCYSDSVAARTLSAGVGTEGGGAALTVAKCTAACASASYTYAGVEYGGECFCGNDIGGNGAKTPIGDCSMTCNGNTTEYCGGPNRLNVYTARDAPSGWSSLGCYTDNFDRTLASRQFPPGDMTVELCTGVCRTNNYKYAGLEYGGECYCGNSFDNGGGPAPDGNAGCNMPCNGDASQTCGGPFRLNVFQYGDGTTQSTTSTPVSSTPPPTPTTTGLPTGWSYQGCYEDGKNGRVMANQRPDSNTNTVETCVNTCLSQGYSVAGMEYGVQCFCDNFIRNNGSKVPETDCNMNCPGNTAEKCGAGNRLSVYANHTVQVLPVPAVQKTGLPENWEYFGCIDDPTPEHAIPYQTILSTNNTAGNCISRCSEFGYSAGGTEYGEECYCGDLATDMTSSIVPESNCAVPCSGNATQICGGQRKMSLYKWVGPPLKKWSYASGAAAGAYQFLIGGVVVPLITQPARNGKITFLEKSGTGAPNTTGAYELDIAQLDNFTAAWRPMHVKSDIFCSASLTLPDKVGRQLNIGGWALGSTYGVRLYWPDGEPGVWGTNDWQENLEELSLQDGRWYPTAMTLANGSILVVGGEEGSNGAPVPTLEILPRVGGTVYCDWLFRTDPNNLYPFLAVLPSGGVFVAYYNEARILNEVTFDTDRTLPNMPAAVNNPLGGRTYPFEGTMVLLPQYAPYTDPLEVLICGGTTPLAGVALDNCVSLKPEVPNAKWVIERMPSKRVLSSMAALPDGTYLILNGAQEGFAGFGLATQPNHNAVLYDPSKPYHERMTVMANTTVDRLYHSEAVVMDDGRVLVSGSDPQDVRFVEEYRVEVFVPPYLMGNPTRPTVSITAANSDWAYGSTHTFSVTGTISKISLMGSESSTHGNNMGQRTIFPAFTCAGGTCTVTAPPNAHVCPPGWFRLFVLNSAGVPSIAKWVRIGGDPASLGNWPANSPSFTVPGV